MSCHCCAGVSWQQWRELFQGHRVSKGLSIMVNLLMYSFKKKKKKSHLRTRKALWPREQEMRIKANTPLFVSLPCELQWIFPLKISSSTQRDRPIVLILLYTVPNINWNHLKWTNILRKHNDHYLHLLASEKAIVESRPQRNTLHSSWFTIS